MNTAPTDWRRLGELTPPILAECEFAAMISSLTESPIETVFGVAMAKWLMQKYGADFGLCLQKDEYANLSLRALMIPQYVWQHYRIDWAFRFKNLPRPLVFVECDGAEFHSTDAQIARDRAKDDLARDARITLLRFTGSDIVRDMSRCQFQFQFRAWGGFSAP